jgi:hypothetical protein
VKLSRSLVTEVLIGIKDDDCLGSGFNESTSHMVSKTTGSTANQLAYSTKYETG